MASFSVWHWLVVFAVVLLLSGLAEISEKAGVLGEGCLGTTARALRDGLARIRGDFRHHTRTGAHSSRMVAGPGRQGRSAMVWLWVAAGILALLLLRAGGVTDDLARWLHGPMS